MKLYEIVGADYSEFKGTVFGQFLTKDLADAGFDALPEEFQYETEVKESDLEINTIVTDGEVIRFPKEDKGFDVVLLEVPGNQGLTLSDMAELMSRLKGEEGLPVEFGDINGNSFALGFIRTESLEKIGYDYSYESELGQFIASILDDIDKATDDGTYEFSGLKIWLNSNFDYD